VEKDKTFAEINKTVEENIRPMGSRIKERKIGVLWTYIIFHSIKIVLECQVM
jgi:hypothetical protein